MNMFDLTYPEYHQEISKVHPEFCLGVTEDLIRLVHGIPVSGKWHSFATIYDPAVAFVQDRMQKCGFVNGDPLANAMENNPRVAFLRALHWGLGVAYNVPPMVHHGSDIEAKEGMLNLLYSIYQSMRGQETACPVEKKRRVDVSPPGTRNQIFLELRNQKYFYPPRTFEPGIKE